MRKPRNWQPAPNVHLTEWRNKGSKASWMDKRPLWTTSGIAATSVFVTSLLQSAIMKVKRNRPCVGTSFRSCNHQGVLKVQESPLKAWRARLMRAIISGILKFMSCHSWYTLPPRLHEMYCAFAIACLSRPEYAQARWIKKVPFSLGAQ